MRRSWLWGIVLGMGLVMLLGGCRRRGAVRDARRVERYEARVAQLAARDSRCPAFQVQPVRVAQQVWVVNTCTGPREYFLECRDPNRMRGCHWRRIATVNEAAAAFLQCPPPAIQQMVGQNPMVRGAAGCGRQVQVALQCHPGGCGWMAMGPPAGQAPAPGAPTAPPGYGAGAQGGVVVVPAN